MESHGLRLLMEMISLQAFMRSHGMEYDGSLEDQEIVSHIHLTESHGLHPVLEIMCLQTPVSPLHGMEYDGLLEVMQDI
jgi:hypothetical protein